MSRIGNKPIEIPDGVDVSIQSSRVSIKGAKGELAREVSSEMSVKKEDGTLVVERPSDRGEHKALHGLTRSLISTMIEGVCDGYEKRLEIQGVGYRAKLKGKQLELSVGLSHPVLISAPQDIEFELPSQTEIIVRGIDKQLVGQVAAEVRKTRPPEPYKGKGIRYMGEHVIRKEGKRA